LNDANKNIRNKRAKTTEIKSTIIP